MIYVTDTIHAYEVTYHATANIRQTLVKYYDANVLLIDGSIDGLTTCEYIRSLVENITDNDIVIIQHPVWYDLSRVNILMDEIRSVSKATVVFFVHDVLSVLYEFGSQNLSCHLDVEAAFTKCDIIVLPSESMLHQIKSHFNFEFDNFILYQDIFDWSFDITKPILFPPFKRQFLSAGNIGRIQCCIDKFDILTKVYGVDKIDGCDNDKIIAMGTFSCDDVVLELNKEGGYGLVWTDEWFFNQYYLHNLPYKITTYLMAGIPLVVHSGACYAEFVKKYDIGLCVTTLDDAVECINSMSEQRYQELCVNVLSVRGLLQNSYFTRGVIDKIVKHVACNKNVPHSALIDRPIEQVVISSVFRNWGMDI